MRPGVVVARVLLVLAILVVLGLGGALLEGRGSLRRRWGVIRARVGVVALVLAIAGGVTFVVAMIRQLRG